MLIEVSSYVDFPCLFPQHIFSKKTSSEKSSLPDSNGEILLPLDWLLKPFRKRFRFHFYGNKQTNSLDKVGSDNKVCVYKLKSLLGFKLVKTVHFT